MDQLFLVEWLMRFSSIIFKGFCLALVCFHPHLCSSSQNDEEDEEEEDVLYEQEGCGCGVVGLDPEYGNAVRAFENALYRANYNEYASDFPDTSGFMNNRTFRYFYNEGRIYWSKEFEDRYGEEDRYQSPTFLRKVKWTTVCDPKKYMLEKSVEEEFVFNKDYAVFPRGFSALKQDLKLEYEKNHAFLLRRLSDLKDDEYDFGWDWDIKTLPQHLTQVSADYEKKLAYIEKEEAKSLEGAKKSMDYCLEHHQLPATYFSRGMFSFLEGNNLEAFDYVRNAIRLATPEQLNKMGTEASFLKGQLEAELGLYGQAVESLTNTIQKDPKNQSAYLERAAAYFELGDFDASLKDYLASGVKPSSIPENALEMASFSLGVHQGIMKGNIEAGVEFIPSLLSTLQGLHQGLWAFAADPVQVSKEFVESAQECFEVIRKNTPVETLTMLVPEIKELVENWDGIEAMRKGEMTGHIIGKYGIEILAGPGLVKGVKAYRNLKRANNLLTFETMALSDRNRALIRLEAASRVQARKQILRHANIRILWDRQGKHVVGHRNYDVIANRSILTHPDPQTLVNKFAGTGIGCRDVQPGVPGYRELVDFGEVIGYAVDNNTGEKILTRWGKIHYAKDGVHIVPTRYMK